MNLGLHKKEYLAAGQYTIADMICYPWATHLEGPQHSKSTKFPNVKAMARCASASDRQ